MATAPSPVQTPGPLGSSAPAIKTDKNRPSMRPEGDEAARIVSDVTEAFNYFEGMLTPWWESTVRWYRLYLGAREDHRKDFEKWRSNVNVPRAYSAVEAGTAALVDIINGADPIIQVEGIDLRDEKVAPVAERLLGYTLDINQWYLFSEEMFRAMAIQGVEFIKSTWANRTVPIYVIPNQADLRDFRERVNEAVLAGAPNPPDIGMVGPEGLQKWMDDVNASGMGRIPALPYSGERMLVKHRGPLLTRVPLWELRFDPMIARIEGQQYFIHRTVQPMSWLEKRTGPEANKPFAPEAVQFGLNDWSGEKLTHYEQRVGQALGLTVSDVPHPYYKRAVEIWEVYSLDMEYKFLTILNQKSVINKNARFTPFTHGSNSIVAIRNVPVPGMLPGISELQQPESLFYELNALRNLRLDAVTLAVLPAYIKSREVGMPELQRRLAPGAIIEGRPDSIQQLQKVSVPDEAFREHAEIGADIDDANALGSNVKGGAATIGRVSATESQSRLKQATLRQAMRSLRIESELNVALKQWIMLWYQFGDTAKREEIGGPGDPLIEVPREELLEAMSRDFRFRGATRMINKELVAQQLNEFGKNWKDQLLPHEARALMGRIYETSGLKGMADVITPDGTKLLKQQFEQKLQLEQREAQSATANTAAADVQVPASVPPDQAAALAAGGGEVSQ